MLLCASISRDALRKFAARGACRRPGGVVVLARRPRKARLQRSARRARRRLLITAAREELRHRRDVEPTRVAHIESAAIDESLLAPAESRAAR